MATTILKIMGSLDYVIQIAVPSGKTVDCNRSGVLSMGFLR
jgi:hypothetical protein